MKLREVSLITVLIFSLLAAAAGNVAGQNDPLQTARDLYQSAAYEEALSELTRVKSSVTAPDAAQEADRYRAFCLVALGRTGEAEQLAESLIRKDPLMTVEHLDASPRIQAMFAAVRKRVLPQVIRAEYRTARALAVQKAPEAASYLTRVQGMMSEAEKIGAWDETLADLRTLVDGFLELHDTAASAPPQQASAPAVADTADSPAPAPPPDPQQLVYRSEDPGVQPPVTMSQPPPWVPPALLDIVRRTHRTGIIDVVIDERGSVAEVNVRQSVNSSYDNLVVAAVRTWKYQPATRNGVPVRFIKSIVVNAEQ